MENPKRNFEFRMSKKVAELTQVVHMLFTRNHEKEVEMDALKGAYENEIELVIKDAKNKLGLLETELNKLQQNKNSKHSQEKHERDVKFLKDLYEKKLKDVESSLQEEKLECQNLRDLLINAQGDIEKLRQGVSEQLSYKGDKLSKKDAELDKLRKHIVVLEKKGREVDKEMNATLRAAEMNSNKLQEEITHMHFVLDESHRNRDLLTTRVKQLELDIKNCKKDFNRKVGEVVSSQVGRLTKSAHHSESEELSRLRKEVQKYRLELSNRDWNFNRMFTEKQPIFVDPRAAGKMVNSQQPPISPSSTNGTAITTHPTSAPYHRERSFSQIITLPPEQKKALAQRPCSAVEPGQLPTLPAFSERTRITKLVKPKPLPKEMLYSK